MCFLSIILPPITVFGQIQKGSVAPDFTLPYLNQTGSFTLSRNLGKKTIIYFWSPLSPQMKDDVVQLQHFYEKYRDKKCRVVTVLAFPEDSAEANFFLQEQNITIPSVVGNLTILRNYQIGDVVPAIFVVDNRRKIIKSAPTNLTEDILKSAISVSEFQVLIIINDTVIGGYKPLPKGPTFDFDATIGVFELPYSKYKKPLCKEILQKLKLIGISKNFLKFELESTESEEHYDLIAVMNIDFREVIERERFTRGIYSGIITCYRFKAVGNIKTIATTAERMKTIEVISPRPETIPNVLYCLSCFFSVIEAPYTCTIGLIPRFVFGKGPGDPLVTPVQGLAMKSYISGKKKEFLKYVINEISDKLTQVIFETIE